MSLAQPRLPLPDRLTQGVKQNQHLPCQQVLVSRRTCTSSLALRVGHACGDDDRQANENSENDSSEDALTRVLHFYSHPSEYKLRTPVWQAIFRVP